MVAEDPPGVIEELGRLRTTRYHDRPVSLYGAGVPPGYRSASSGTAS